MINKRPLLNWSLNSRNNSCVSSSSSGELLKHRSRIAFVTLKAGVESVGSILPLEVFTGVLVIDLLLANGRIAVVGIGNTIKPLLWYVVWQMQDLFLDDAVRLAVGSGVLGVVHPYVRAHLTETNCFCDAVTCLLESACFGEPRLQYGFHCAVFHWSGQIGRLKVNSQVGQGTTGCAGIVVRHVSMPSGGLVVHSCFISSHVMQDVRHGLSFKVGGWIGDSGVALLIPWNVDAMWVGNVWVDVLVIPTESIHDVVHVLALTFPQDVEKVWVLGMCTKNEVEKQSNLKVNLHFYFLKIKN